MIEHEHAPRWHYWILLLSPILLLNGCWSADFTTFDDHFHIDIPADTSLIWYPLTRWSYALDRLLFENWMPDYWGSWAPGVRGMNGLYHACASIVLYRIFSKLGFSTYTTFFAALIFAVHPTACESVCWVSERKNVLVALFGFTAVLTLISWRGWSGLLATFGLYALALFSKPSALGMLPVLAGTHFFLQTRTSEFIQNSGIRRYKKMLLKTFYYILPFALISAFVLKAILSSHTTATIPPPGGTLGTALLTDLEIICRYLFNLAMPIFLSTLYFVEPVRSITDGRVLLYGLCLLTIVGVSIKYSRDRWMTALGWFWMLGALGPCLNLHPNSFFMQDRYFYLSIPGVLIVVFSLFTNRASLLTLRWLPKLRTGLRIVAGIYILFLCGVSYQRSFVWKSSMSIFSDAVKKQPLTAYGHYGLGNAWGEVYQILDHDTRIPRPLVEAARLRYLEEFTMAINCSDVSRFSWYPSIALEAGDFAKEKKDFEAAERYWLIASKRPENWSSNWPLRPDVQAQALRWLSLLRLDQDRPEDAYQFSDAAVKILDIAPTRSDRAKTAKIWADALKNSNPIKAQELLNQADVDLLIHLQQTQLLDNSTR